MGTGLAGEKLVEARYCPRRLIDLGNPRLRFREHVFPITFVLVIVAGVLRSNVDVQNLWAFNPVLPTKLVLIHCATTSAPIEHEAVTVGAAARRRDAKVVSKAVMASGISRCSRHVKRRTAYRIACISSINIVIARSKTISAPYKVTQLWSTGPPEPPMS